MASAVADPAPTDTTFSEERILTEGQKDGERNIPEMGSYMPAPFEQALIAHGEQAVHRAFAEATARITKLRPEFERYKRQLDDLEHRLAPIAEAYKARTAELGRDVSIPFPPVLHWALVAMLALGEFPLNTVVFRMFGEPEYLTYVMASTLAIIIPLIGVFIGIHVRHSIPRTAGNVLIGLLTPVTVGAALYGVSVLRNAYMASASAGGTPADAGQHALAYSLFALNALVFFGAMSAAYFSHDPDERLDQLHKSLRSLDRTRDAIRKKLFPMATAINGEIQAGKSQIEQVRALTAQRIALYRQTNIRCRTLLPPPSFRKDPEFPRLAAWPEVSVNGANGTNGASHEA